MSFLIFKPPSGPTRIEHTCRQCVPCSLCCAPDISHILETSSTYGIVCILVWSWSPPFGLGLWVPRFSLDSQLLILAVKVCCVFNALADVVHLTFFPYQPVEGLPGYICREGCPFDQSSIGCDDRLPRLFDFIQSCSLSHIHSVRIIRHVYVYVQRYFWERLKGGCLTTHKYTTYDDENTWKFGYDFSG